MAAGGWRVAGVAAQCRHRPDRIGVEGAGRLGRQATLALQHRGLTVVEVPPQLTAQARRRGRSQAKTDPIDALLIARITLRDANLPTVRGDGPLEALRSLVDYRRELLAERTRLSNRLHADLEQLRPGYQRRLPSLAHPTRSIGHGGCWPTTPTPVPGSPASA